MSNYLEYLPKELLVNIYLFLGPDNVKDLNLFTEIENLLIDLIKKEVLFKHDSQYLIVIEPTYKVSIPFEEKNAINNTIKYYFLNPKNCKFNIWSNKFLK